MTLYNNDDSKPMNIYIYIIYIYIYTGFLPDIFPLQPCSVTDDPNDPAIRVGCSDAIDTIWLFKVEQNMKKRP